MGEKVWIVTAGQYSSYHIVRVFSREETATAFAALRNAASPYGKDHDVEEHYLDTGTEITQGWSVVFHHSGGYPGEDEVRAKRVETIYRPGSVIQSFAKDRTTVEIEAKTEEQAIKAAAEVFAQWKAAQAGIS